MGKAVYAIIAGTSASLIFGFGPATQGLETLVIFLAITWLDHWFAKQFRV